MKTGIKAWKILQRQYQFTFILSKFNFISEFYVQANYPRVYGISYVKRFVNQKKVLSSKAQHMTTAYCITVFNNWNQQILYKKQRR